MAAAITIPLLLVLVCVLAVTLLGSKAESRLTSIGPSTPSSPVGASTGREDFDASTGTEELWVTVRLDRPDDFVVTESLDPAVGDGSCEGTGHYADVHQGSEVHATDGQGRVLFTTELDSGYIAYDSLVVNDAGEPATYCEFSAFLELPLADSYTIVVPNHGEESYAYDTLAYDKYWEVVVAFHQ